MPDNHSTTNEHLDYLAKSKRITYDGIRAPGECECGNSTEFFIEEKNVECVKYLKRELSTDFWTIGSASELTTVNNGISGSNIPPSRFGVCTHCYERVCFLYSLGWSYTTQQFYDAPVIRHITTAHKGVIDA